MALATAKKQAQSTPIIIALGVSAGVLTSSTLLTTAFTQTRRKKKHLSNLGLRRLGQFLSQTLFELQDLFPYLVEDWESYISQRFGVGFCYVSTGALLNKLET